MAWGFTMVKLVLRPSSAERWMNCPASINYTDSKTSVYATKGTKQHELAAEILTAYANGHNTNQGLAHPDLNSNTIFYINTIIDRIEMTKRSGDFVALHIEKTLEFELDNFILRGTPDCVIEYKDCFEILDLKDGYQSVLVKDNPQLLCYAFLARVSLNKRCSSVTIVQDSTMNLLSSPTTSGTLYFLSNLDIQLDKESGLRFFAGDWCQFCPHRMDCFTYRKSVSPFAATLPQLKDADPTTLGHLFALSKFLKSYLAEVEEKVKEDIIKNNKDIPGFKAVEGRGMRQWSKPEIEIIETLKVNGLTEDQYLHPKYLKSYTEIEKLNSEAKKLVSELVHVRKGITIVPISDPRPAIGPIPEFDPLPLQGDSNG